MRVLSTIQVPGDMNVLGITIIAILILTIVLLFWNVLSKRNDMRVLTFCTCIVLAFSAFQSGCRLLNKYPYCNLKTQYECILEEGKTTEDIPKEYKVVSQRGDIYVLERIGD